MLSQFTYTVQTLLRLTKCLCKQFDFVFFVCIVRLAGSGEIYKGRVEIFYNRTWGTVCGNGFSDIDAGVICYILGFGYV